MKSPEKPKPVCKKVRKKRKGKNEISHSAAIKMFDVLAGKIGKLESTHGALAEDLVAEIEKLENFLLEWDGRNVRWKLERCWPIFCQRIGSIFCVRSKN